jgi:glycosyltransferase involved in cell wall biosynthesis
VILCFDAIHCSQLLRQLGIPLFCLPGSPMFARELRLNRKSRGEAEREIKLSRGHLRIAQALLHGGRVGFASYSDRDYAAKYLGVENGLVVGMGFPRQTVTAVADEPIVLFVGNMTQPNVEGLDWFITGVWPKIRGVYPSAKFRVVGRVAAAVQHGVSGIEAIGPVRDLSTEYAKSQVVIAPLLSGTTGVKIKIAEAMAYGRPLVATSVGIDPGQRHQLDPGTFIADTEQDFATSVLNLLTQPSVRAEKCRGATQVYESWFSQEACYREVAQWIDAVANLPP